MKMPERLVILFLYSFVIGIIRLKKSKTGLFCLRTSNSIKHNYQRYKKSSFHFFRVEIYTGKEAWAIKKLIVSGLTSYVSSH